LSTSATSNVGGVVFGTGRSRTTAGKWPVRPCSSASSAQATGAKLGWVHHDRQRLPLLRRQPGLVEQHGHLLGEGPLRVEDRADVEDALDQLLRQVGQAVLLGLCQGVREVDHEHRSPSPTWPVGDSASVTRPTPAC
jgi:hypothetical protein